MTDRITGAMMAMIAYTDETSDVRLHDTNHFLKVWSYAHTIGTEEGLSDQEQETLELAAIVHDIACPLCRKKYGNTDGAYQEKEGPALVRAFYQNSSLPADQLDRICWLVGHHHTYTDVDGRDYQILLEADFLVNADEAQYSEEAIRNFKEKVFRTETGKKLLHHLYHV